MPLRPRRRRQANCHRYPRPMRGQARFFLQVTRLASNASKQPPFVVRRLPLSIDIESVEEKEPPRVQK